VQLIDHEIESGFHISKHIGYSGLAAAETVPVSAQTRWTISINANETGAK
jgi:hypothetical protein